MATTSLTDLPQELLGRVLSFLLPSDIVRFGRTCRQAYSFINPGNQLLWQDAFLHVYDDPEPMRNSPYIELSGKAAQWDWYHQVKSRSEAIKCLKRRWPIEGEFENQQSHLDAILSIIDTAAPRPSANDLRKGAMPRLDDRSSRNIQLLTSIIAEDDAGFERITFEIGKSLTHSIKGPTTRSMSQSFQDQNRSEAARRLHTLTGLSHRDKTERRNFYRRYVYDWALTSDANDHGPFLKDSSGRVDWTLLEGAMVCISHSFQITVDGSLAAPEGLWYSIPHRTLQDPTLIEDWAGVTGRWLGTYAFLDYSSLLAWNTGLMDPRHGYSTTLDLRDEPEAVGDLLLMDLKLDDSCRTDPILRSNVPISDRLPPLYFKGTSRGSEYPNHPTTVIKGFAALMVGGREVKWKFIVEYHGVDQWQLEGIQPGGIRSGGIFGLWSNAEHEPNGPVGPFCYYPQQLCKPTSVVLAGGQD